MQGDQTASKLKMRAPSSVVLPSDAQMQDAGIKQKIQRVVNDTCAEICNEAPLVPEDAKALADAVKKAGAEGIALQMKDFSIAEGGRIRIEFERATPNGVTVDTSTAAKAEVAKKVTDIVHRTSRWVGGSSTNLVFMTPVVDKELEKGAKLSDTAKSETGL